MTVLLQGPAADSFSTCRALAAIHLDTLAYLISELLSCTAESLNSYADAGGDLPVSLALPPRIATRRVDLL